MTLTTPKPVERPEDDRTKFVVGLGNPSRKYSRTRHNVGFRVVRELARRWNLDKGRKCFGGRLYDARSAGKPARLFEPLTFMNNSGSAVRDLAGFYKAACRDILVVLDDMALPLARLRARAGGSPGGHKGLLSVCEALAGEDLPRIRIGIGQAPEGMDAVDFVLAPFSPQEEGPIESAIRLAGNAVEDWIDKGLVFVMDNYNKQGKG